MTKHKSKVNGELKEGGSNQQLGMQSSKEESTLQLENQTISATLENSQDPKNQVVFQPTQNLKVDDRVTNFNLIAAFASKLGSLAVWEKFIKEDGTEYIALAFPLDKWMITPKGSLVPKEENKDSQSIL